MKISIILSGKEFDLLKEALREKGIGLSHNWENDDEDSYDFQPYREDW